MAVPLTRSGARNELIVLAIELTEPLYKLLFRPSHWNALVRNGLQTGGSHWIWRHLGKRFTPFSRTDLGYDAEGTYRSPIERALSSGLMDRLGAQFWHGWNPWHQAQVPVGLWREAVAYEKQAGRMPPKPSKTWFRTLKKELRRRCKADLKRRVEELSQEGEIAEKLPLVHTGDLRSKALSQSRAVATATSNNWTLRIKIPQPHPTHPSVNAVLSQATDDELREIADVTQQSIIANAEKATLGQPPPRKPPTLIFGDDGTVTRKWEGPARQRRSLSTGQLSTFANEHRSRQTRHRSRTPAAA